MIFPFPLLLTFVFYCTTGVLGVDGGQEWEREFYFQLVESRGAVNTKTVNVGAGCRGRKEKARERDHNH